MKKDIKTVSAVFGKMTKTFEVISEPLPHCFIESQTQLRGWYQDKDAVKPRTCTSEYFLTTPYRGCIGKDGQPTCTFCYLPFMRGYFSTGVVCIDKDYPRQLKSDLEALNVGFAAYISPFCECFNDLEEVYHMTQQTAEIFDEYGLPVMFTTKRRIPEWAIKIAKHSPYSSIQVSINTLDNNVWKKLAPIADDVSILLDNLRRAKKAGVYTLLRIDPILVGITTKKDILNLVGRVVNEEIVDHIVFSFAEFGYASKKRIFGLYKDLFPDKYMELESAYTEKFGGNYIVGTDYRVQFFKEMSCILKNTNITMSTCSELVPHPDGSLIPMATAHPDTLTSISCHGVRVPVHKKGDDGKFHAVTECYGACLHCKENPCGEPKLNEAKSNTLADYKKMIVGGEPKPRVERVPIQDTKSKVDKIPQYLYKPNDEDFIKFSKSIIDSGDVDPVYPILKAYFDEKGYSLEERLFGVHLYLTIYNTYWTIYLLEKHYPDLDFIELLDDEVIKNKQIKFGTDRRGVSWIGLDKVFHDFDNFYGDAALFDYYTSELTENAEDNYLKMKKLVLALPHNGEWASYKHIDLLTHCAQLPIHCTDWWVKNRAFGGKQLVVDWKMSGGKLGREVKETPEVIAMINKFADEFTVKLSKALNMIVTHDVSETCACKYHATYNKTYYAGHDLDKMLEELHGKDDDITRLILYLRSKCFKPQDLGEISGWNGVRSELKGMI